MEPDPSLVQVMRAADGSLTAAIYVGNGTWVDVPGARINPNTNRVELPPGSYPATTTTNLPPTYGQWLHKEPPPSDEEIAEALESIRRAQDG